MPISLFDPTSLGPHRLQNHFVMNPMTRSRAGADGVPGAIMATYYGQRATVGLIVTEGVAPSADGRGYARIPGLWTQAQVAGWRRVTEAVHAKGGVIFAQLMHTGRVSHPANMDPQARILAPGAAPAPGLIHTDSHGMQDHPLPQAMTEADIAQTITDFATAARNAVAAGFDGIELHAAHGYLLDQFLSPLTNTRTDLWGGSVANRIRFVVAVAQAVAAAIGGDRVGIRLSPHGAAAGMQPYAAEAETCLALTAALAQAGLVYLHVVDHPALDDLSQLRQSLRAKWPRSFMTGGSTDLAVAAAAIAAGQTDLISIGRAFIANPDLIRRLQHGLPLAEPDAATFYTPGPAGYTDYPFAS